MNLDKNKMKKRNKQVKKLSYVIDIKNIITSSRPLEDRDFDSATNDDLFFGKYSAYLEYNPLIQRNARILHLPSSSYV